MNPLRYLAFCLAFLLLISCGNDEPKPEVVSPAGEAAILDVQVKGAVSTQQAQQIDVTIFKPTPCHTVKETKVSGSGTTVNYDFILQGSGDICAQVIAEEVVSVTFNPQTSGVYTLNFLIDGKLYKTEQVNVTN